jgi:hypothetical protein
MSVTCLQDMIISAPALPAPLTVMVAQPSVQSPGSSMDSAAFLQRYTALTASVKQRQLRHLDAPYALFSKLDQATANADVVAFRCQPRLSPLHVSLQVCQHGKHLPAKLRTRAAHACHPPCGA